MIRTRWVVMMSALTAMLASGERSANAQETTSDAATRGTVGYGGEALYLRSPGDKVVLFPGLRLQLDGYGFLGPSVDGYQRANGTGLKPNLSGRRARLELGGRVLDRYYFFLGGDWGGTALDAVQRPTATASLADAFGGIDLHPLFDVRIGQFDVPFMMESVTSDKSIDFMERSLTVRTVGAPSDKDGGLMIRGALDNGLFDYALAVVGGDGKNRPSVDARVDVMGRLLARPLAGGKGLLSRMHVGGSFRWGKRDPDFVFYDVGNMTTAGGYAFWSPVYGKGATETHVYPSNAQSAFAGELYLPIDRFDFRAEVVYVKDGRREAFLNSPFNTERIGTTKGLAYYVQASYWPIGRARINGEPGRYPMPKLKLTDAPTPDEGLQIAARFEQVLLQYDSIADAPGVKRGSLDGDTRNIKVNVGQLAVNFWATRHLRFTLQYSLYHFPGVTIESIDRVGVSHVPPSPAENQAGAPGARPEAFDFSAHLLHEIGLRAAAAL